MGNWKRESIRTRDGGQVESSQVVRFPFGAGSVCVSLSLDFGLHRRVGVDDHLIRPPSDVTPLPPTVVRQTEREGVPTFIPVVGDSQNEGEHLYGWRGF